MPPKSGGLRRLPGPVKSTFFYVFRQWLSGQSLPRRLGLGAALYLVLALAAYAAFGGNACAVTVDGREIAVVADEKSAREALGELLKGKSDQAGRSVAVVEKVAYRSVRVEPEELLDPLALQDRLNAALTFKAKGTAVLVNGEAKLFLKQKEEAEQLLAWLKTVYPGEDGEQLEFKEQIEITEAVAEAENILDLEAAKKLVLLGANKVQQYTVKDGDTLWNICRAQSMDMDQILFSNPGMSPERLKIGQVLNLSKEAPLITVVGTRQVTLNEEIPYTVDVKKDDNLLLGEKKVLRKGVTGERVVTYRITRENGFETDREVLEENVLKEASTEVVAKGSLTMVASRGGSLRLGWPSGGGIVSRFGMREGRMHEGVDIGAAYGSAAVATAGGKVIAAGWFGSYGNCVDISHGNGLVTRYAHLSSINVRVGQSVDRGQLIGRVGATGRVTGPNLHYEVLVNGQPRNPANYLP